jgi:hypothetical protein
MRIIRQIELFFNRPAPKPRARRHVARSDEFLFGVWVNLRQEFFPECAELDSYVVAWASRPQKRVLASCNITARRVNVARELFEPAASRWIAPVLYHEMCHAAIGMAVQTSTSGKRMWHGTEFRRLEALHPDIPAMNAWIQSGGWAMAVRSYRSRRAWQTRVASQQNASV